MARKSATADFSAGTPPRQGCRRPGPWRRRPHGPSAVGRGSTAARRRGRTPAAPPCVPALTSGRSSSDELLRGLEQLVVAVLAGAGADVAVDAFGEHQPGGGRVGERVGGDLLQQHEPGTLAAEEPRGAAICRSTSARSVAAASASSSATTSPRASVRRAPLRLPASAAALILRATSLAAKNWPAGRPTIQPCASVTSSPATTARSSAVSMPSAQTCAPVRAAK